MNFSINIFGYLLLVLLVWASAFAFSCYQTHHCATKFWTMFLVFVSFYTLLMVPEEYKYTSERMLKELKRQRDGFSYIAAHDPRSTFSIIDEDGSTRVAQYYEALNHFLRQRDEIIFDKNVSHRGLDWHVEYGKPVMIGLYYRSSRLWLCTLVWIISTCLLWKQERRPIPRYNRVDIPTKP